MTTLYVSVQNTVLLYYTTLYAAINVLNICIYRICVVWHSGPVESSLLRATDRGS